MRKVFFNIILLWFVNNFIIQLCKFVIVAECVYSGGVFCVQFIDYVYVDI